MKHWRVGREPGILVLFIATVFLSGCAQGQLPSGQPKRGITRNLEADMERLFPSDSIDMEIMDQVVMSPRRQELMGKFTAAVEKNREWFLSLQQGLDSGKAMTYDPRIGLTESEYVELQQMIDSNDDISVVSSGMERVLVLRSEGVFRFRSQGRLDFLNSVSIDARSNLATLAGHQLVPQDTICVTSAHNVFKSSWRGYKWQFATPENVAMPTTEAEVAAFSLTLYTITIGLIDSSGKTLLEVAGSETHQGQRIVRYKYPLVF